MLPKNYQFSIGADPEIFLGHEGKFISAHDKLPGTKAEPFVVPNGAVQVDGMATEFNIDPAYSYEEFQFNLSSVQKTLQEMIGDNDLLHQTTVEFDEAFAKQIPIQNLELGCSSDFDAWLLDENPAPDASKNIRTAGGHVHIGGFAPETAYSPPHFMLMAHLARIMDWTLGVPSLSWDKDDKRRQLYGKAGCFRPTNYGMEYRTLSNAWLFNPKLVKFVYEKTREAVSLLFEGFEPPAETSDIINSSNRQSSIYKGAVKP